MNTMIAYTSKYFLIEMLLPITPIPTPNTKYTVTIKLNISLNSNKLQFAITKNIVPDIWLDMYV